MPMDRLRFMEILMNSKKSSIRKQQSILMYSGLAMIIFGIWSIVRTILMRFIDPDHFKDYISVFDGTQDVEYINIVFALLLIALLIDLSIRVYIGVCAMQEGQGKLKNSITYVIIALIVLFAAIGSDFVDIITHFTNDDKYTLEIFLTTIIDISIHIATLEVIVSAIKIRILIKEK